MRVNAQLVDAESGNHLWAERFDKPVTDLFETQDEIITRLARQLDAALISAEARRASRAPHPDSTDLFFQGRVWFDKSLSPNDMARAQSYFECALMVDPDKLTHWPGTHSPIPTCRVRVRRRGKGRALRGGRSGRGQGATTRPRSGIEPSA
jgi:hypothetical protein